MDTTTFWKMINTSRRKSAGDLDEQCELLNESVAKLDVKELLSFDKIFQSFWVGAYTWDLWGAAYILGGGCSDDLFMDFRGWLVSRGEKVYHAALADADSLAKVVRDDPEDCLYEGFQYTGMTAWQKKTGRPLDDYPAPKVKQPKKPKGRRWSEDGDDLAKRFPKLWKKFADD